MSELEIGIRAAQVLAFEGEPDADAWLEEACDLARDCQRLLRELGTERGILTEALDREKAAQESLLEMRGAYKHTLETVDDMRKAYELKIADLAQETRQASEMADCLRYLAEHMPRFQTESYTLINETLRRVGQKTVEKP